MSAVRDFAAIRFLTFADAAFPRMCSGTRWAAQRISPERLLKSAIRCQIQTDLSL